VVAAEFITDEIDRPADGHDPDTDYERLDAVVERTCRWGAHPTSPSGSQCNARLRAI
jgi:hypothetical protein